MKESTLLRIALSLSLLGLSALFIIIQTSYIPETPIANLTLAEESSVVKIEGVVSEFQDNGKTARIKIAQPQTIGVFLYKSRNLSLEKGDFVEITGEISEYNGRKEIIASEVDVLG